MALGSTFLLHAERAAILFWGACLALTVFVQAMVDGELPVELSTTGARYREHSTVALADMADTLDEQSEVIREVLLPRLEELEKSVAGRTT